tara:strand:- start:520 stop:2103 length:1584 start_codon:yes stop_codon:yes gene_type:complete
MSSFSKQTKIFEVSDNWEVCLIPIKYKNLIKAFNIMKSLKLDYDSDSDFIYVLNQIRLFFYKTTNYLGPMTDLIEDFFSLDTKVSSLSRGYPEDYKKLVICLSYLEKIINEKENILVKSLEDYLNKESIKSNLGQKEICFHCDPNQINNAKKLNNLFEGNIKFITDPILYSSEKIYDEGFRLGNMTYILSRNNKKLLQSPRIKKLNLIYFEYLKTPLKEYDPLNISEYRNFSKLSVKPIISLSDGFIFESEQNDKSLEEVSEISFEGVIEEIKEIKDIEIKEVLENAGLEYQSEDSQIATAKCSLFEFTKGGSMIFENEEKIRHLKNEYISSETNLDSIYIDKDFPEDLEQGDCLLLFASDLEKRYLHAASKKVNKNYESFLESNKKWKDHCKNFIERNGEDFLFEQFRSYKIPMNRLEYWLDYDAGGPRSETDFENFLIVIGYRMSEISKAWECLVKYRKTRVEAGVEVSHSIQNSISSEDMQAISKEGFKQFKNNEFEGAKINAYLIDSITDIGEMPLNKTRKII